MFVCVSTILGKQRGAREKTSDLLWSEGPADSGGRLSTTWSTSGGPASASCFQYRGGFTPRTTPAGRRTSFQTRREPLEEGGWGRSVVQSSS